MRREDYFNIFIPLFLSRVVSHTAFYILHEFNYIFFQNWRDTSNVQRRLHSPLPSSRVWNELLEIHFPVPDCNAHCPHWSCLRHPHFSFQSEIFMKMFCEIFIKSFLIKNFLHHPIFWLSPQASFGKEFCWFFPPPIAPVPYDAGSVFPWLFEVQFCYSTH